MKQILAAAQRELLAQLAWSNVLLGFDYDGTLAPIVSDPAKASLRAPTRKLLAELARLYPCVVISGRSVRDVQRRLKGIGLRAVIGNHGLEPWSASEEILRTVEEWKALLQPALDDLQGVELEDKRYSLALHYRRARAKKTTRARILRAVRSLGEVRVIGGKQVVNLLPLGAPHKGMALERERECAGCDTAFFLGDDDTDEDVFALDRPGRLLSVRVGASADSHAMYCLKRQREVDLLLGRLIALRRDAGALQRFAR
ncbi:MAG: trehalose-phosphatase [Planctomycetota bacterium]